MQTFYTSRSAIETYQECPQARYLKYLIAGRGIVPSGSLIYLSTGSAVHKAVEFLGRQIMKGRKITFKVIDEAVEIGTSLYKSSVTPDTLRHPKIEVQEGKTFAYHEQLALTEALIRIWGLIEGPKLAERFEVVSVELDVANKLYRDVEMEILLESKADMVLREKDTGYYYVYSLKTAKQWDKRSNDSFGNDLQGITEIWGTEKHFKRVNKALKKAGKEGKYPDRVMGVRFCFLIKGGTKEKEDFQGQGTGVWFTYNPFIRGYRQMGKAAGWNFAHSWYYSNPANKSGKSMLGKGWEPFNVWEDYAGGVANWVKDIYKGEIQPNYNPSLGQLGVFVEHVVTPPEVMRRESEIGWSMEEVKAQEIEVYTKITDSFGLPVEERAKKFHHHRRACNWPVPCDNKPICWGEPSRGDGPIDKDELIEIAESGEGFWKFREPHHKREMEMVGRKGG